MHDEENTLIKKLSYFTKIPEFKLYNFVEKNNIQILMETPEAIKPTLNQLENINKIKELNKLYKRLSIYKEYQFKDSIDMTDFLDSQYPNKYDKEQFIVAYLDKDNKLLSCEIISTGTLNSTIVHPRDVFKQALKYNSNKLVLSHNHPSGNPKPSQEDIRITERLIESAKLLDIEILDHIIVGRNSYCSFKEDGYLSNKISLELVDSKPINNRDKMIYKGDIDKTINLLNKFTKIPKTELKNILKKADFNTFINNPDKYIKNEEQLDKLNKLKFLNKIYKDISYRINKVKISGPDCLIDYIKEKYASLRDKDYNIATYLNTKNEVIESVIIPDNLTVKKEFSYIFENAILYDSNSFIMTSNTNNKINIQNHTIDKINDLKEKSYRMGIRLLDNIDIGTDRNVSYQKEKLLKEGAKTYIPGITNTLDIKHMQEKEEAEDEWGLEI